MDNRLVAVVPSRAAIRRAMDRSLLSARWPLLARVPEEDLEAFFQRARTRRFDRGQIVFHEHDPADALHLIKKGRFAVQVNVHGERAILTVLGPGESFGELALIDGNARRSAAVLALEPASTLVVHAHEFERLRNRRPSVEKVLSALLASQVRRLSDQLAEALYLPVDVRVRRRLHALLPLYGSGAATTVSLTQQKLAELAGTTRQAVNRVLRGDEAKGILEIKRGELVVHDPEALARGAQLPLEDTFLALEPHGGT